MTSDLVPHALTPPEEDEETARRFKGAIFVRWVPNPARTERSVYLFDQFPVAKAQYDFFRHFSSHTIREMALLKEADNDHKFEEVECFER